MSGRPGEVSPSQTVGPFFSGCLWREDARHQVLVGPRTSGTRIRLEGRVLDGDGAGVPDALVEIWQANSHGRFHHPLDQRDLPLAPDFTGHGRSDTDENGRFWFETIFPGSVPLNADGSGVQAPHISVTVFARGLLNHLTTRVYFPDTPQNDTDPILSHVPADRRSRLIATPEDRDGQRIYRFDVVLQADRATETPFLEFVRA